ncbi:MAG: DUF945 family protein [Gammaproteobacteria bacterium]
MGRRIGLGILAIIVIIVAAAAITPYFVGRAAESNFKAQIAYVNARYPNVVVHVDSYHRGFYSSEAELSFAVGAGTTGDTAEHVWQLLFGSDMSVTKIHLRINHGPIPFAAFGDGHVNFMPVLYSADFRGESASSLSLIAILKPDAYVVQTFTGSTDTTLTIPPGKFNLGPLTTTWQGGRFSDSLNSAHDRMHYSGEIKSFGFRYQDAKTNKNYGGSFKGFDMSGTKAQAGHGFWTGEDRITSKGAQFDRDNKPTLTLAGADYRGGTTETSDGQWLGASGQWQQRGGQLLGWNWSSLDLQGALNKLDAAGLHQAMEDLRAAQKRGEKVSESSSLALLYSALPKAIKPETRGNLKLVLNAPDGNLDFNLSGGFDVPLPAAAAASAGSSGAALLAQRADWHLTVDFDRELVDGFSTQVLGGAAAAQSVDQTIAQWQKQGYLQADAGGGRYHSDIVYRAGKVTINGHVVKTGGDEAQSAPSPASSN